MCVLIRATITSAPLDFLQCCAYRACVADTARHVVVALARSTSAINAPLGFRSGPGVGLLAHSAVFAAVAIASIAE